MRIVVLALLLAACSSAGEKAEERYRMVEAANPTGDELCQAARGVADAYLADGKEDKFRETKNRADITCLNAELDRRMGR
jgi:hypothetical protein